MALQSLRGRCQNQFEQRTRVVRNGQHAFSTCSTSHRELCAFKRLECKVWPDQAFIELKPSASVNLSCRLAMGTPRSPRRTASSPDWDLWFSRETQSSGTHTPCIRQGHAATPLQSNLGSQELVRGVIIDADPRVDPVQADMLRLLQYPDWDQEKDYMENPPTCIRYTVDWKITLNNRTKVKNTERDVVLQPAAFFDIILSPKVKATAAKKISPNKNVQLDDIGVIVSVNDRTERDLNWTFDPLDIDWAEIEEQLVEWGELCRAGKKLRVDLSFNYKDSIPDEATASSARGARGRTSATSLMLAEQARQIDAEEASTGHPAIWTLMYRLFRCPGPPCDLGPHCLIDSVTKKHRRLKAHHMRQIIEHVKQGGQITTHDDVPQAIRDQLDAEERDSAAAHGQLWLISSI